VKHLFVINPSAAKVKNNIPQLINEILDFFSKNRHLRCEIHVTRWKRDASGYVHRYLSETDETVRIHSFGGSGTLFEIVNGAVGLPNAEIASYPLGENNEFILYFGKEYEHLFRSIETQVASGTTPVDAIRSGNVHGISHSLVGLEARSNLHSIEMAGRTKLPTNYRYILPALKEILLGKAKAQKYKINIDGVSCDGNYISINIANGPCYGKEMCAAIDAHPNDGFLEVYMINEMSALKLLTIISPYTKGEYRKAPKYVKHFSGKKIVVSSNDVICFSVDGENFYDKEIEFEAIHHAIKFVIPNEVDLKKLPRIYNHPEEGCVGDR